MTFANDPVSSVRTHKKTTKEEQELLFCSPIDYERFEYYDCDCLQTYQELKWEWEWERDITSVMRIQSAACMFYSKHTLQKIKKRTASTKLQLAWCASFQFHKLLKVLSGIQVIQSSIRVLCERWRLVEQMVIQSSLQCVTFAEDTVSAIFYIPAHNIPVCIKVVQCSFPPQKTVVQCGPLTSLPAPRALDFHKCPFTPRKPAQF